ncbi:MAG: THUMP-like domain-containing protein [Paludibacteraceae bacterium]
MNQATKDFIKSFADEDVINLSLKRSKFYDVDIPLAIRQIEGKQKVRKKIPTFFVCEDLLYPVKLSLEQSSSEITADYKSKRCDGKVLVDLTGGFGVDSYFFSFRFEQIIYVERQEELCGLAEHNFKALKRTNIQVVCDSAEKYLTRTKICDWIYLDPARRTANGKKTIRLVDSEPDVTNLAGKLLEKSENVMIKLSPMIDIASILKELPQTIEIHIIAVENECKEIIAIMKRSATGNLSIRTINIPNSKPVEIFDFQIGDEECASTQFANDLNDYLYEPNAAVMKSGAFKLISEQYAVAKLHNNSHLYTSNKLIRDFPGRIFRVKKIYDFSKEAIKQLRINSDSANLAIRNFPMTVDELRKRLKLLDGGDTYLFATTVQHEKRVLISCFKV